MSGYAKNLFLAPCLMLVTLLASWSHAEDMSPLGALPTIRSVTISPNGQYIAWIQSSDGEVGLRIIQRGKGGLVGGLNVGGDIKARAVRFANDNYAVLHAEDSLFVHGYRGRVDFSGAVSYSLENGKTQFLLKNTPGIHPAQEGLGRILTVLPKSDDVIMPAFVDADDPPFNLYKVDLKSGRGTTHARGKTSTIGWYVAADGNVLVREDFEEKEEKHRLFSYFGDGEPREIYSEDSDTLTLDSVAISADETALIVKKVKDGFDVLYAMSLEDGALSGPVLYQPGKEIDSYLFDRHRRLIGVKFAGLQPSYEFLDPDRYEAFQRFVEKMKYSSVHYLTADEGSKLVLVMVAGNHQPNAYYILQSEDGAVGMIASGYPDVEHAQLGKVQAFEYQARDGLTIPAIFTWPVLKHPDQSLKDLPLIVLPHGGPESFDQVGFDWFAQYFATLGYAVLQANFRGSSGFGEVHLRAGRGKWGREMQTDLIDGIDYLAKSGTVDPRRVCIAGMSYGGYSALAAGAFDSGRYRCHVAINGVSDVKQMLDRTKYDYGNKHWVVGYWLNVLGDSAAENTLLEQISPINFVESFDAPTLVVFSSEDSVVKPDQSRRMIQALKRADKPVEQVVLRGDDHYLSFNETRGQLLEAVGKFVMKHNPPD